MAFGEVVIRYNNLPKLEGALRREVKNIVEDSALDCMNKAKQAAPFLTGTLRRSIHAEPDDGSGLTWTVGTDVEYARRIEFGFVGQDRLGRNYNQAAQPYLTPAAEAVRPVFMRRMREAVEKAAR